MEPDIDAHSHIGTPDVGHYPLTAGFRVEDMQRRSFAAEERLAQCRSQRSSGKRLAASRRRSPCSKRAA